MDVVFELTGAFGAYQKLMFLVSSFLTSMAAITIYATVFTTAEPKLICVNTLNRTIIQGESHCSTFQNLLTSKFNDSMPEKECYFERTHYHDTMITDYNFICEKKFYAGLLQTFHLLGTFSTLFIGFFSDRYGRRRTLIISMVILSTTLIFTQLANINIFNLGIMTRYFINLVAQFIIGATCVTMYVVGYTLLLELTTNKYGNLVATLHAYIYVIGEFVILAVSFFLKNWNHINLFVTIYSVATLIVSFIFLPESPRYLITRNRLDEAFDVINKIKKVNQGKSSKPLDKEEILNKFKSINDPFFNSNENLENVESVENGTKKSGNKAFEFAFKSKQNFIQILVLLYIWFALSVSYYGVSLGKKTYYFKSFEYFECDQKFPQLLLKFSAEF